METKRYERDIHVALFYVGDWTSCPYLLERARKTLKKYNIFL